jgi:hypothetical protein
LAPFYTSWTHGRTFSSLCACVHAFRLPYTLHIGLQFSESSGISNTHSSLGFVILLLLRWILLDFLVLILWVVGLIVKALLVLVIFLNLLLFVGSSIGIRAFAASKGIFQVMASY